MVAPGRCAALRSATGSTSSVDRHFQSAPNVGSPVAIIRAGRHSLPVRLLRKTSRFNHEQNRMTETLTFADYAARLRGFIASASGTSPSASAEFRALALALFDLQFQHNVPYQRLCLARGVNPEVIQHWSEIPAVPASAFKDLELTSLPVEERTTVFHSSGTTGQARSRHFHSAESLALYEASLMPWFERHLLADVNDLVEEQLLGPLDKLPFLALTPPPTAAPHSSLVHMFDTVRREFGARDSLFAGRTDASGSWTLDLDTALFAIRKSMCANRPLVLLGTAFNFVHLLDHFAAHNMRYRLARGSRVLETGGYKGQSREVPKRELHALISKHLGIAPEFIVTEYGMSELSSQAYDRVAGLAPSPLKGERVGVRGETATQTCSRQDRPHLTPALSPPSGSGEGEPIERIFHFPPWCRVQVISPETGREVAEGETGLLRLFDLANVRSVMAIQTEDLAMRRGAGFELLGRVARAEPRGCSLLSLNAEAKA